LLFLLFFSSLAVLLFSCFFFLQEVSSMFMRENRKKNGAVQPEQTASEEASKQRTARQLDPNGDIPSPPDDWRFNPSMSTPAAINEGHYQGGVSGSGPYGTSYEQKIPYVGNLAVHTEGDRSLKSR
jgi:hypothetical protein